MTLTLHTKEEKMPGVKKFKAISTKTVMGGIITRADFVKRFKLPENAKITIKVPSGEHLDFGLDVTEIDVSWEKA